MSEFWMAIGDFWFAVAASFNELAMRSYQNAADWKNRETSK